MNRETTNRIRFVLEDMLPPVVRDSRLFRGVARLAWGEHIDRLASFRARAPFLTEAEYEEIIRQTMLEYEDEVQSVKDASRHALFAEQCVNHRRFADIRTTGDSDTRHAFGAVVFFRVFRKTLQRLVDQTADTFTMRRRNRMGVAQT